MSSIVDYYAARGMATAKKANVRKLFLWVSIFWNLGVLFIFKYFNFFLDNFTALFYDDITTSHYIFWNVLIPVGLSFYTFQTMSYSLDVYRRKIKPTHNLIEFLCFVSFFPQLVAGPIERAGKLLPQFQKERKFNLAETKDGLRRIMWGLFKKMVVADNAALAVNAIYATPEEYGSLALVYASALFFFQIYCDFSGYSDIAIGTAKLFGFKLSKNFNIPYLSRSVSEFWQRWHITLTRWFTDYVYGPIVKYSKRNYALKTVALFITMTLIGLWHGANWTFVAFGFFQAVMISIERMPISIGKRKVSLIAYLTKIPLALTICYSFTLIMISCIFFRSDSIETAFTILKRIVSFIPTESFSNVLDERIIVIPALILMEIFTRRMDHPFQQLEKRFPKPVRWLIYYIFVFVIFRYAGPKEEFIYFQF